MTVVQSQSSPVSLRNYKSTKSANISYNDTHLPSRTVVIFPRVFISGCRFSTRSLCLKHGEFQSQQPSQKLEGFSVLPSDVPFESDNLLSNFGLYLFSLHVPMSFGGLSAVAYLTNQSALEPQIEALSLLTIQTLELIIVLFLLKYTARPESKIFSYLKSGKFTTKRNWLLASIIGFAVLVLSIFLTSLFEDLVFGPKGANNPILKQILQSGDISRAACAVAYCIITPILEETVYRGYLLSTLASTTKWQNAMLLSSAIFSFAHFSPENAFQLSIIGCVLGTSYCWTGNLRTPILIHSLYNAVTLVISSL